MRIPSHEETSVPRGTEKTDFSLQREMMVPKAAKWDPHLSPFVMQEQQGDKVKRQNIKLNNGNILHKLFA